MSLLRGEVPPCDASSSSVSSSPAIGLSPPTGEFSVEAMACRAAIAVCNWAVSGGEEDGGGDGRPRRTRASRRGWADCRSARSRRRKSRRASTKCG